MENYRSPKAKQGGRRVKERVAGGKTWGEGVLLEYTLILKYLSVFWVLILFYLYVTNTADPQFKLFPSTSLHYDVDETPKELKSCLFQLAYGKICFSYIQVKVTEPIEKVRWGFTVFSSRIHNLFHLSEDLLYLKFLKYSSTFSSYTF